MIFKLDELINTGEEMVPIRYTYDTRTNTLHSHGFGKLTSTDLQNHITSLLNDPQVPNSFNELCNLNAV